MQERINHRRAILGLLWGSGGLLVMMLFAGGLGVALGTLGDEAGASACLGAAGVLGGGFLIVQILLITHLALAAVQGNMDEGGDRGRAAPTLKL